MKIRIPVKLALFIASHESDRDWEFEIDNAPRKKKKRLKKDLSRVIINLINTKAKEIIESAELLANKNN